MKKNFLLLAFVLTAAALMPIRVFACTANDFGAVVDQTAQALRDLNADGAQRFQAKLKEFQQKYDLSDKEIRARAASLQDQKMTDFNREIDQLVGQMDVLSQTPNEQINCEKLEELKRVRDRLLTVMGQKSGYMLAKADLELDRPAAKAGSSPASAEAETGVKKSDQAASDLPRTESQGKGDKLAVNAPEPGRQQPPKPPAAQEKPEPAPKMAEAPSEPGEKTDTPSPALNPDLPAKRPSQTQVAQNWSAEKQNLAPQPEEQKQAYASPGSEGGEPPAYVSGEESYNAPADNVAPPTSLVAPSPGEDRLPPPLHGDPYPPQGKPYQPQGEAYQQGEQDVDTTYSIEEISEAGRGIFGTVTAQFAAAINYAFQNFGRPNAYITGSEGGAAFLAGLRYGKGKLHSKVEPLRTIYWQGPSVGLDMGAEGSSGLFLVYNLDAREKLYGRFTGVGGSAYVAGGVGLNVLAKDGVIIAPIRTGLGLRLGANVAYLKFTERQTWNPF